MSIERLLVVVDVQADFLPGGALAVPDGDAVIPVIRELLPAVDAVVATRDWHPAGHVSFAASHAGRAVGDVIDADGLEQVLWPVHCVQETPGAAIDPGLRLPADTRVFDKGTDPAVDSYSGFFDNGGRRGTGLAEHVAGLAPREVLVAGLATDYCVLATVLDACRLDHRVVVVADGCRAVNLQPGDADRAFDRMREAGATISDRG